MNLRKAAQQALEALELGCTDCDGNPVDLVGPAITTLRAALAEDVPETNFGNMAQAVDLKRDDIIRLAREAGDDWDNTLPEDKAFLARFAALVAAEREACAKVCDENERANLYGVKECASAIRARGEE